MSGRNRPEPEQLLLGAQRSRAGRFFTPHLYNRRIDADIRPMSASPSPSLALDAARLAAAMLRFQEPLAPLMQGCTPAGQPVVGVNSYSFVPFPKRVLREDVPAFLASLPCPAMLAPTIIRGIVTTTLLGELSPDRQAAMQHELDNQLSFFQEDMLARAGETDRVLLEFDDESLEFPLGAVRYWAGRYGILVGWNLVPSEDRGRAEWRINLIAGDGHRYSKGGREGLA